MRISKNIDSKNIGEDFFFLSLSRVEELFVSKGEIEWGCLLFVTATSSFLILSGVI